MTGDDLWLAVKFQSNLEIAGSPRNSFRASVGNEFPGGKALNELGGASLLNSIKLRMPEKCLPAVRLRVIKSVVKRGNSPDPQLRSPIHAKWKTM